MTTWENLVSFSSLMIVLVAVNKEINLQTQYCSSQSLWPLFQELSRDAGTLFLGPQEDSVPLFVLWVEFLGPKIVPTTEVVPSDLPRDISMEVWRKQYRNISERLQTSILLQIIFNYGIIWQAIERKSWRLHVTVCKSAFLFSALAFVLPSVSFSHSSWPHLLSQTKHSIISAQW